MTAVAQIIQGAVVPVTPTAIYTGPANQQAQLTAFTATNNDISGAHLLTLWIGSITTGSQVGPITIPAGSSVSIYQVLNMVINGGASISAIADQPNVLSVLASANVITN